MQLSICNSKTKLDVSDAVFGREYNSGVVHQVVVAYQAAARSGNSAQKTRSEVTASGRKPWKQKGTGNARAGTVSGPIWRGGGAAFAAKKRDYRQKVNKKMYRVALRSVLSELLRQQRVFVIDSVVVDQPKTKVLATKLAELDFDSVLIVIDKQQDMSVYDNLYLAARNLPHVTVVNEQQLTPVALLSAKKVLLTKEAVHQLEGRLA